MGWIRNLPNSTTFWLALVAIVLVCSIGLPAARWEWLRSGASEGQSRVTTESTSAAESSGPRESNSTTVRNIGFIVAGVLALVFAVWRGVLAQRQAETAQRQSETSQQGLLNERYQKGAEMLGSEVLSVRLGGIYALQRLAEEHPQQYHVQIMQLFCAFVRSPTGEAEFTILGHYENGDPVPGQREDVQAVMNAIDRRTDASISLEEASENFHVGLQGVKLQHAHLAGMNLSGISFGGANLSGAVLEGADLSDAWFISADLSSASLLNADLSDADLSGANLSDAILIYADLSGADLSGADLAGAILSDANLTGASFSRIAVMGDHRISAKGLTQAELDEARSDPDNPPNLEGVLDAETDEQLVWQGKLLEEEGEES